MSKKIVIVGAKPKRVNILDKPKRRVEPAELANALGAKPLDIEAGMSKDPIAMGELGSQLLHRLRSSGGRPALVDATVQCRVPLSEEDVKSLEELVTQVGAATGAKPSVGQVASVIVRLHLNALKREPESSAAPSDMAQEVSRGMLQKMIDDQIGPLRDQVMRLEAELHSSH
jgi:hypothetical protein